MRLFFLSINSKTPSLSPLCSFFVDIQRNRRTTRRRSPRISLVARVLALVGVVEILEKRISRVVALCDICNKKKNKQPTNSCTLSVCF